MYDWYDELEACLLVLDDCDLHCDGVSHCVTAALQAANITCQLMVGYARHRTTRAIVVPHCWVELPGKYVVDFRLRMWLGDDDEIPHGVFRSLPVRTNIEYAGEPMHGKRPARSLLEMMSEGRLSQVVCPPPLPELAAHQGAMR